MTGTAITEAESCPIYGIDTIVVQQTSLYKKIPMMLFTELRWEFKAM
jgi:hypothetical protein